MFLIDAELSRLVLAKLGVPSSYRVCFMGNLDKLTTSSKSARNVYSQSVPTTIRNTYN